MSTTIQNSFVKEFESEVHLAYQRMGSRLRPSVRTKSNIKGSHAVFQKIGKGIAGTKSRHGMIPVVAVDHTPVECQLSDYYTGSWLDAIDELKIEHEERQVLVNSGAYALGRKTDELIINALNEVGDDRIINAEDDAGNPQPLTRDEILDAFKLLGESDVPDDGERYVVVSWKQWSDLLKITEFSNADYVGDEGLPWQGRQSKRWLGSHWIAHSGLPIDSDNVRSCFWYHKTAVGHAAGQDVVSDITWHGDRASHFISNRMSQGATLIDPKGVVVMKSKE